MKVLSASGSGSTAGVISGVDYVAKNKRQFPTVARYFELNLLCFAVV